jgi:hypothetical protein
VDLRRLLRLGTQQQQKKRFHGLSDIRVYGSYYVIYIFKVVFMWFLCGD